MNISGKFLGDKVKSLRIAKKLTQRELADILGVAQSYITRWERGSSPTPEYLEPLASALGVRIEDIFETSEELSDLKKFIRQEIRSALDVILAELKILNRGK